MAVAANGNIGIMLPDDPQMPDPQRAMLDATPDCVKILSPDGKLLMINDAGRVALGLPAVLPVDLPWLTLLPAEVHAAGGEALRRAATGETARFPGRSESAGGVMHWDNLLIPVVGDLGAVLSIMCVSRDVTERVALEQRLAESLDRERLLAREMRHRIKNLFSVVSGLILLAEKEARTMGPSEAATAMLRGKLDALARASEAAFAHDDGDQGDDGPTDLDALVRSVLAPYGGQCVVDGAAVAIRRETMTTLALCLHELATNSLKYGALKLDGGRVTLRWTASGDLLDLHWIEAGGPDLVAEPARQGFGSEMMDRIMRSAGGSIVRSWHPAGLAVDLHLPASIHRPN